MAHAPQVIPVWNEEGDFFMAFCEACRWAASLRRTSEEAADDLENHLADVEGML